MNDANGLRIDTSALDRVERLVSAKIGLRPSPSVRERAIRAIANASRRNGGRGLERVIAEVEAGGEAYEAFVDDVAVGETYFFREADHFAFLRDAILPALVAEPNRRIRLWSAGCASGEEPYSLAIVLKEAGALDRALVLGTDVSRAALARARAGIYREWSLRGAGAKMATPYLRTSPDGLKLNAAIRRAVLFEQLNLARDDYPSLLTNTWAMDVIFCRNVLYYFDTPTIARVVKRLADSLVEGGWLVLSASDPLVGAYGPLEAVVTDGGVLYRKRGPTPHASATPEPQPRPLEPRAPGEEPRTLPSPPSRAATPSGRSRESEAARDERYSPKAIRELASSEGTREALERARAAVKRDPVDVELQFLVAVLLDDAGEVAEAAEALRRVLYLDHTLAVAHYRLGLLLYREGDRDGAVREFQNARRLARGARSDEPVPLGDGERAGTLGDAAAFQIRMIEDHERA